MDENAYTVTIFLNIEGVADKDEALASAVAFVSEGINDRCNWEVFKIERTESL